MTAYNWLFTSIGRPTTFIKAALFIKCLLLLLLLFRCHPVSPRHATSGQLFLKLRTYLIYAGDTVSSHTEQHRSNYTNIRHSQPTSFTVSHSTVDITWPYHVTGSALSVVGPSLSLVRQSGTRYRGQSPRPGAHQQQLQTIAENEPISSLAATRGAVWDASWLSCAI